MPVDETVKLPKDEFYEMLDVINEMVCFCSCYMPADRYYAVANAVWVLAHRGAGDDKTADQQYAELKARRAEYVEKHL